MGTLASAIEMKFLVALAVLTVVGAHATSDIVVKVEEEELSPLLRTFCCGNVQQRCARACTGRSCSLRCQGYCGVFNSRCGPYTCSSVTNACQSTTTTDSATTTGGETTTGGDTTTGDDTTTGGATTTAAGTTSGDATTTGSETTTGAATTTESTA